MAKRKTQNELIAEATKKAIKKRDKYVQTQIDGLVEVLEKTENEVKLSLLKYKNLGSLSEGKTINQKALKRLKKQIKEIATDLKNNQSLIMTGAVKATYQQGIYDSIESLVKGKLPFYAELTKDGISKTAKNVFQLVDTDALDFLVNFNMQLVGEVSRELADGINKTIQLGITSGKDVSGIVRDMGSVIKDKEAFRRAGKTVFKTAQTRMTLIARTEIIRAHNQGQIKFYDTVGVEKFIWQTADDERTCPICQPLDEQSFIVGKDPAPTAHPDCRCWTIPEIPEKIKTPEDIKKLAGRSKK